MDAVQWAFGLLVWWLPQLLLGVLFLTELGPSAFLAKTMPSRHTS